MLLFPCRKKNSSYLCHPDHNQAWPGIEVEAAGSAAVEKTGKKVLADLNKMPNFGLPKLREEQEQQVLAKY